MDMKKVNEYVKKYGITKEEAMFMVADDEIVDHMTMGEINKSLTADQKQAIKEATKTTSGKKANRKPREKKEDADKRYLISLLLDSLISNEISSAVVNAEREISISYNGAEYTLNLVKHRAKKA